MTINERNHMHREMEKQLKPCPFCGGKPEIRDTYCYHAFAIHCTKCSAGIGNVGTDTLEKAVKLWNRRYNGDKE